MRLGIIEEIVNAAALPKFTALRFRIFCKSFLDLLFPKSQSCKLRDSRSFYDLAISLLGTMLSGRKAL